MEWQVPTSLSSLDKMDDMCNRGKFSSYWPRKESETELGRPNKPYNGGGTPQGFRKKHTHRCMRRYLQERGWCQRIYLGAGRRKKKDKQRRADLEMEREESEEATLQREAQGQQEALAENKGE